MSYHLDHFQWVENNKLILFHVLDKLNQTLRRHLEQQSTLVA